MATATALDFNKLAQNRLDIVFLFDVTDGNPNGDPDAGNVPRTDSETGQGLITDVALKRKVRDYVARAKGLLPPFEIYVKHAGILANEQKRAFMALGAEPSESPNHGARDWMCKNYYDIRAFGAVMTTGKVDEPDTPKSERKGKNKAKWNCGQVRGPMQFTFARSIQPIVTLEQAITRVALTNAGDTGVESSVDEAGNEVAGSGQFGRKSIVPYGLYRSHIFFNPHFAKDTGFTGDDLQIALDALQGMFEIDRSAARGQMSACRIYAFAHDSALGNAPAARLFDSVEVLPSDERASGGAREESPPRKFRDYKITFEGGGEPDVSAERQMKAFPKVRVIRFL